ncbi:hypothetical protein EVAR_58562_1 [Eumeta japonica]|uniref:Uncharacterized protein n=1 Tax=Eumeta variegata TaxID=151549 RepID=A0A4C1YH17_EUMVA|nr:hypothetical protein EVAR_58562_1 [Eumeta japonica]
MGVTIEMQNPKDWQCSYNYLDISKGFVSVTSNNPSAKYNSPIRLSAAAAGTNSALQLQYARWSAEISLRAPEAVYSREVLFPAMREANDTVQRGFYSDIYPCGCDIRP